MAITSVDGLIAGLGAGFRSSWWKNSVAISAAQNWASFWQASGFPGPGSTPPSGAGEAPTNSTSGALLYTNPSSGNNYLAGLEGSITNTSLVPFLYDRLVHTSGLSGTVTTAQTVNSAAITRPDATGAGAELFLEFYVAPGASQTTFTVSYTNSSGTSGQVSQSTTLPINCKAGQLIPVGLAAGDTGVRSVQSVTLVGSTGGAGSFGITIGRRISSLPTGSASAAVALDPFTLGFPQLYSNACLWTLAYSPGSLTVGPFQGMITVAAG